jgi:hypothetical protein
VEPSARNVREKQARIYFDATRGKGIEEAMRSLLAYVVLSAAALIPLNVTGAERAAGQGEMGNRSTSEEPLKKTEEELPRITYYCCDPTGVVRCSVSAPGPVESQCFCPGIIGTGKLCLPPQGGADKQ